MRTTRIKGIAVVAITAAAAVCAASTARADLTPATGELTIAAGSSGTEEKVVTVPALPAKADIVIAIDTTGSMGLAIDQAKAEATALVTQVQADIPDANFAVVDFKDFGDVPAEYAVLQANTNDAALIQAAIDTMSASGGGDFAEAQNLVISNAAVDGAPLWRADSRRFLVLITDAPPHDADVNGFPSCPNFSGPDPHGLVTSTVVGALAAAKTTLFAVTASSAVAQCYTDIANVSYAGSAQAPLGTDLSGQITALIAAASANVQDVHLEVVLPNANASWVSFSPASAGPLPTPATVNFTVTVAVPSGTPAGSYAFDIVALADGGDVGHQALTVKVPSAVCAASVQGGFGPPINNDGSSVFKLGSTIPVKVVIVDCHGALLGTLSPDVDLVRIDTSPEGSVNEVVSSAAADTGDNMRFTGSSYMFNLSTKRSQFNAGADLVPGTYRLTVDDSDSATPAFAKVEVVINLKK